MHQNLNTLRSISVTLRRVARLSVCSNGKTCRHGVSSLEYKQNVRFARCISSQNIYRDPFCFVPTVFVFFHGNRRFCFFPPHLRALVHTSPAGVSTSLERKREQDFTTSHRQSKINTIPSRTPQWTKNSKTEKTKIQCPYRAVHQPKGFCVKKEKRTKHWTRATCV